MQHSMLLGIIVPSRPEESEPPYQLAKCQHLRFLDKPNRTNGRSYSTFGWCEIGRQLNIKSWLHLGCRGRRFDASTNIQKLIHYGMMRSTVKPLRPYLMCARHAQHLGINVRGSSSSTKQIFFLVFLQTGILTLGTFFSRIPFSLPCLFPISKTLLIHPRKAVSGKRRLLAFHTLVF